MNLRNWGHCAAKTVGPKVRDLTSPAARSSHIVEKTRPAHTHNTAASPIATLSPSIAFDEILETSLIT